MVFTSHSNKDVIYPLTVKEITQAQKDNAVLKYQHKHAKHSTQFVEDTQLLCKDGKMAIPQFFSPIS
jgi:inosine/xanthosine triphosphate pyrophosphatase family protein